MSQNTENFEGFDPNCDNFEMPDINPEDNPEITINYDENLENENPEIFNPETHPEDNYPGTPELNLAPPSQLSQTPGGGGGSQSMGFMGFPQTPGRGKKANNQILSNFKQIDAREVKVHMWNLIEHDDLLPRTVRPKNCDKKSSVLSNYKVETRRTEVKKFSDLQVGFGIRA